MDPLLSPSVYRRSRCCERVRVRKRGYRPASFGKRQENGPLIYSTVYKSFVFTLLVAVFHVLEDAVKGVWHGEGLARAFAALRDRRIAEVLAAGVVYFCALLPFFALREIRRVFGEARLADLFFRSSARTSFWRSLRYSCWLPIRRPSLPHKPITRPLLFVAMFRWAVSMHR